MNGQPTKNLASFGHLLDLRPMEGVSFSSFDAQATRKALLRSKISGDNEVHVVELKRTIVGYVPIGFPDRIYVRLPSKALEGVVLMCHRANAYGQVPSLKKPENDMFLFLCHCYGIYWKGSFCGRVSYGSAWKETRCRSEEEIKRVSDSRWEPEADGGWILVDEHPTKVATKRALSHGSDGHVNLRKMRNDFKYGSHPPKLLDFCFDQLLDFHLVSGIIALVAVTAAMNVGIFVAVADVVAVANVIAVGVAVAAILDGVVAVATILDVSVFGVGPNPLVAVVVEGDEENKEDKTQNCSQDWDRKEQLRLDEDEKQPKGCLFGRDGLQAEDDEADKGDTGDGGGVVGKLADTSKRLNQEDDGIEKIGRYQENRQDRKNTREFAVDRLRSGGVS
ncbi:hypothetical protein B0T24DRAFT_598223 [Lasiosphaeria ovina]|uniref:Uncharacterized protein n=1 Tax=Lasiosphaeria ovina TaxID=92902 RepID=A0AAE0JVS7_9PEZI|nr:hypothetical protein B0T24DRAFT_598223 [Lasiosphaeria ovina]